eukprot:492974_1
MNIYKGLNHSYPWIKYYARTMCTKIHQPTPHPMDKSRVKPSQQEKPSTHAQQRKNKSVTYPRRFSNTSNITEEQKTLIIENLLTHRNPANVLYSEKETEQTTNAYVANLIIDMVYSTYCETGQGIALYDTQFEKKWKQFIVRKFNRIFPEPQLTQLVHTLCVLPPYLSNYTRRVKYFILYEYDRISFKKPVYIFPSDSFIASFVEYAKHSQFNNTVNTLHDQKSPYLRKNKLYKYNENELYHRMAYLFENNMYKNGLYLHEIASVFEQENQSVLSLKPPNARKNIMFFQKGMEALALNPYFEAFYDSKYSFSEKLSLQTLIENAGCLYCGNQHISRVMVFGNHMHGRYQNALLTILKNDDYLHSFQFVKTKMKENYPDLYNELNFERQNEVMFTRVMLQRFGTLLHIYRVPTINRYNEDEPRTEIKTDLYDLRYQRRYLHCLSVFTETFNEKLYDLVRGECMKRMMLYDKSDFVIGNHGIRISEFETLWNAQYPYQIFPFQCNEYALFYHLIEFQSHNIRALPINNMSNSDAPEDIEANKMYYYSYQFVPVQPYNNQTYQRLVDTMGVLQRKYRRNTNTGDEAPNKHVPDVDNIQRLKKEYTQNISYLLKTFRNDGIPLCDFARLFEFKYHNMSTTGGGYAPLLSFNPDIMSIQVDAKRNLLNIGNMYRSLSNMLVVWGALITPKTKPIQQQMLFPLRLGVMNWMTLTSLDYYNHKGNSKGNNYSIPWNEVKQIGQDMNNANSMIHKHRQKFFGAANTPETKLWIMRDTEYLKQQSFYKFASNITLSHKYIHSPRDLATFWPNNDANLMLFRRPVAPICDYDMLTLSTLYESPENNENRDRNKEIKTVEFYKFIDGLMDKYSCRMKQVTQKTFLFDYLSMMSIRIMSLLSTYIDEYSSSSSSTSKQVNFIRWSTFMNRYETLFGRLIVPSFDIDRSHNVIFGIFGALHCNIIDFIGSKEYAQEYLIGGGHFEIPSLRGMNQVMIQFPHDFERKYLSKLICDFAAIDVSINMNKFHKSFVPISFLLSSRMLEIKKYNNLMMCADINKMDTNWKKSDSFYALSMDPLTRNTVDDIMNAEEDEDEDIVLNDKFRRLLSRQVYCIATIREILSGLSAAEWAELSNTNVRHILDGFVMRGEVCNAYKMMMIWFRDELKSRYELYAYLLSIYLNDNNLSMSYQIYEYLMQCLHAKACDRSDDDYYYEAQMMTYCIAECTNKLLPKCVENGHFYLFDCIMHSILFLRESLPAIVHSIDPFVSNKNLKVLLQTLTRNELYSRLLPLVELIKHKSVIHMTPTLIHSMCDVFQLASQNDTRLHSEIVDIMYKIHGADGAKMNWHKILQQFVAQYPDKVHMLLNHAGVANIYANLGNVCDVIDVADVVDIYAQSHNLNLNAWQLMIEWMKPPPYSHALIHRIVSHCVVHECLPCLVSLNYGDAIKWIELTRDVVSLNYDDDDDHSSLIVLLQTIATMNDFNAFFCVLDELPLHINDRILTLHFVDIMDCFINDDAKNVQMNPISKILHTHSDRNHMNDSVHAAIKLNVIADAFEKKRIPQKEWTKSIRKYQSILKIDAISNNREFKQNIYDVLD